MTLSRSSTTRVPMTETIIEPIHPSPLEKKTNTPPRYPVLANRYASPSSAVGHVTSPRPLLRWTRRLHTTVGRLGRHERMFAQRGLGAAADRFARRVLAILRSVIVRCANREGSGRAAAGRRDRARRWSPRAPAAAAGARSTARALGAL